MHVIFYSIAHVSLSVPLCGLLLITAQLSVSEPARALRVQAQYVHHQCRCAHETVQTDCAYDSQHRDYNANLLPTYLHTRHLPHYCPRPLKRALVWVQQLRAADHSTVNGLRASLLTSRAGAKCPPSMLLCRQTTWTERAHNSQHRSPLSVMIPPAR